MAKGRDEVDGWEEGSVPVDRTRRFIVKNPFVSIFGNYEFFSYYLCADTS